MLAKNFLKVVYKFEMNFGLRSFGIRENLDLTSMMDYLQSLFEFTRFAIQSENSFVRQYAVGLLAAWCRVNSESVNQKLETADTIRTLIVEISSTFIKCSVQDLNLHEFEEEEEEQFETGEQQGMTSKNDIVARLLNVDIQTSYIQMNEGLSYLFGMYKGNTN